MGKVAIPLSGGFDSIVCYLYAINECEISINDIFLYNLDYGQPYQEAESKAVSLMETKFGLNVKKFKINLLDFEPTVDNEVIPARNFLIAYLGAFNADEIFLSAPKGEYAHWVLDKNPNAYITMSDSLSKLIGKEVTIKSIIEHKTKTDWLKWLFKLDVELANWIIFNSVSCHGKANPCGNCSPCLWKWCQFVTNGYNWQEFFPTDPTKSIVAKNKISELSQLNCYTGVQKIHFEARKNELFTALKISEQRI